MSETQIFDKKKILVASIHIVIGTYLFLYTAGVFNPCQDNVAASLNWGSNKDLYIALFSSIIIAGVFVGACMVAYLVDRFGRRSTMMISDVMYAIGAIILVIPSTPTFAIGRAITGLASGIFMTVCPIYLNELTPEEMIPIVGPFLAIADSLGLLSAYAFSLPLPTDNLEKDSFNNWWIFMFLFPVVICIYQFCYFKFFWVYDTPQYYMARGMKDEARLALGVIYSPTGFSKGLNRLTSEIEGKFSSGIKPSIWNFFTNKQYRKMIRVGLILMICEQLSGYYPMIFYSTAIFQKLGGSVFISRVLTLSLGVVKLISTIVSIFLLRCFGRKTLLVSGQVLLAVDLFLMSLFSGFIDFGIILPAIFTIGFFIFYSYSFGTTLWIYVGEILNDQILSISFAVNNILGIIISFVFPIVVEEIGISITILFFTFMMVFGVFYSICDLVETKNKNKTQILVDMRVLEKSSKQINSCDDHDNHEIIANNKAKDYKITDSDDFYINK